MLRLHLFSFNLPGYRDKCNRVKLKTNCFRYFLTLPNAAFAIGTLDLILRPDHYLNYYCLIITKMKTFAGRLMLMQCLEAPRFL